MSQIRRSVLTLSAVGVMIVGASQAAELVSWDFSGVTAPTIPDNTPANGASALSVNFDLTTSLMVRGSANAEGASGVALDGAAVAGTPPAFPSVEYYYEFTITPKAGVVYSISDVTLALTGNITEWWIYSSEGASLPDLTSPDVGNPVWDDAAAAYIGGTYPVFGVQPAGGVQSADRSGQYDAGFNNLTGPVSFRVHGFTGNEFAVGGPTSLEINGSVSVPFGGGTSVPETFPMWSIGLLFAGLVAARSVESRRRAPARA